LGESRAAVETLRMELAQREKSATALNAANEKLQLEIEQTRQTIAGLESIRTDLINQNALKTSEISDLENRLSNESIARQSLVDEHRIVNDQAQITSKRLAALDTEVVGVRQKIALAEDEKRSLQNALEQALADMSRVSRQLTESNNALTGAQTQVTQLETRFAETDTERLRLLSALDEANERHRSENSTQTMRLDALQSRTTTAEKLLVEARTNLAARADEIRAFERKITDATIARNAAEKKLAQIEGAQQTQERMIKDLEQARTALVERNTALGKNVRTRENELVRAEEKIQSLNELVARLEADIQNSRSRAEKRSEDLTALLEHERMDRSVAEGALEATRKDNARLQRENARLEALVRHGSSAAGRGADSAVKG
jgi:crescentin